MSSVLFGSLIPVPDKAFVLLGLPAILGFFAVYWALPRPRSFPVAIGGFLGIAAVILAGGMWLHGSVLTVGTILFFLFSGMAVVGAGLLVTQRNPVHAALSFALVVLSTCGIFLIQAAPFLMAATIIVYAGAIIVTFLFVIMLAQQAGNSDADHRSREPFLAAFTAFLFLGTLVFVLQQGHVSQEAAGPFDRVAFRALMDTAETANSKTTLGDINDALGKSFFADLSRRAGEARGAAGSVLLAAKAEEVEANWPKWQAAGELPRMRRALGEFTALGKEVLDSRGLDGSGRLPASNVAFLGRLLYTDYLLAIELAGTLLLVATVGAIVIAARRPEVSR